MDEKNITNQIINSIEESLYISKTDTVQPNVLLRTPLFVPVGKHKGTIVSNDITESFRTLELFKSEGYDSVIIEGKRLNPQTDFKVWCGIIFAFSKYGYDTDAINLPFSDFVKLCGYPSKRIDKNLRLQIEASLGRLQGQNIRFKRKDAKKSISTSLVLKASYDFDEDVVSLVGDKELWEVYRVDHQILVSLNVLQKIPKSETAQCLYLFIVGLPQNPLPITLSRMRARLLLNMPNKEANRSIKKAIEKLESIGYLKGEWVQFNGEAAYLVHVRDRELLAHSKGVV
ncbi:MULTISPECIES: RepB family plasmid replication initiator protein [Vibrio]|uniref:RepB family plasmid replication initiator protein n=1 Tax=Vibrio TaxID=662 RepID=UPI001EED5843|nr:MULTISPECIES: RepB family plasmid replication initiator protein [Vibrio]MCR9545065.1 RepB family plasmid replication initiator protein [Vibrio antiquarius]MCR9320604.1 RepB family plasmid replication initiator protein [Vibrio alginolyticus]MCR9488486.1 RepB family plasmid replication initiator protein [Vibrio alginolyticus]MCR9559204.1 RepB family plasmid replication initiator protein [Vibrio alginolyticus]MCR9568843.1 RepB family plasmid replication initiator protein [Vibrio alginolyticus]